MTVIAVGARAKTSSACETERKGWAHVMCEC